MAEDVKPKLGLMNERVKTEIADRGNNKLTIKSENERHASLEIEVMKKVIYVRRKKKTIRTRRTPVSIKDRVSRTSVSSNQQGHSKPNDRNRRRRPEVDQHEENNEIRTDRMEEATTSINDRTENEEYNEISTELMEVENNSVNERTQGLPEFEDFDIDDYHPHADKCSLVDIFNTTFNCDINRNKILSCANRVPTFTIVNCEDYPFTVPGKFKRRHDFVKFICVLEAFGARTTMLSTRDAETSIPILYESVNKTHNALVARSWQENEVNHRRIPRDVFSEDFISNILDNGKVGDLNKYRIGDSKFRQYDANAILRGELRWNHLRRSY